MEQKPQIPTLKDSQKPQVKIKGLQAGLSLIDRLKQFKKKDLAFISAGLGVLFMAPLAEHFMMAPESGGGTPFREGWDFKGNSLGANASPYESGINGLAPGGVTGGGDIITPLNVRDPSSLIMGPGAQQQAPATSVAPPPPPPAAKDEWKDAYANAASRGVQEATKRAALPVPKAALTNAGLRGLGAVGGGGGGSYTPGAISSQGLTGNRAADSNSLSRVTAAPGFRGAAGPRGGQNASAGSMEALKKASAGALDSMNRSGPGSSALETAASMAMNGGSSGGSAGRGQGGEGGQDKGPGGNQDKNAMNVGESLEFMRMKAEQEKAIDLKWKLKENQAMLWPDLKKKMLEELAMAPIKGISAGIADMVKDFGADNNGLTEVVECQPGNQQFKTSDGFCTKGGLLYETEGGECKKGPIGNYNTCRKISVSKAPESQTAPRARDGVAGTDGVPPVGSITPEGGVNKTSAEMCSDMVSVPPENAMKDTTNRLQKVLIATMVARKAMIPQGEVPACGRVTPAGINMADQGSSVDKTIKERVDLIEQKLRAPGQGALKLLEDAAGKLTAAVGGDQGFGAKHESELEAVLAYFNPPAPTTVEAAQAKVLEAAGRLQQVQAALEGQVNPLVVQAEELINRARHDMENTPLAQALDEVDNTAPILENVGKRLQEVKADLDSVRMTVAGGGETYTTTLPGGAGSMTEYYTTASARYQQEVERYQNLRETFLKMADASGNARDRRTPELQRSVAEIRFLLSGGEGTKPPALPRNARSVDLPGKNVSSYQQARTELMNNSQAGVEEEGRGTSRSQSRSGTSWPTDPSSPTYQQDIERAMEEKKAIVTAAKEKVVQRKDAVLASADNEAQHEIVPVLAYDSPPDEGYTDNKPYRLGSLATTIPNLSGGTGTGTAQ
jgi:hypothetical protein